MVIKNTSDIPTYEIEFAEIARYGGFDYHSEKGWVILCKLFSLMGLDFRAILIFTSIIIIGGVFYISYKYSEIVWLSVFIFLCTSFLHTIFIIRQGVAVSICLFAIPYILKRKILPFLALVGLAVSMHTAAIIFIPAYFIYKIPINRWFYLLLILMVPIAIVVLPAVMTYLAPDRYLDYFNSEGSNLTPALISTCIMLFSLFFLDLKKLEEKEKLFLWLVTIEFIISCAGIGLPINRLLMYYSVGNFILLPNVLQRTNNLKLLIIPAMMYIYYIIYTQTSQGGGFRYYRLIFMDSTYLFN
jgi:hypothetical protein